MTLFFFQSFSTKKWPNFFFNLFALKSKKNARTSPFNDTSSSFICFIVKLKKYLLIIYYHTFATSHCFTYSMTSVTLKTLNMIQPLLFWGKRGKRPSPATKECMPGVATQMQSTLLLEIKVKKNLRRPRRMSRMSMTT